MSNLLTALYLKSARHFDGKSMLTLLAVSCVVLGAGLLPAFAEDEVPQQLPPLDLSSLGVQQPNWMPALPPEAAPNGELPNPATTSTNRKPEPKIAEPNPASDSRFESGVKAYRDGDYAQAAKVFEVLHRQAPENTRFTYYLAITEAQLGRFQQAKKHYNEIVTLDPNGETASFAKEGLKYLPPETSLDLPPRFNQQATGAGQGNFAAAQPSSAGVPANGQPTAQANAQPAISPQDLMAWQMLMGQGNGNNSGGFNPMGSFMPGMMMGMPNGSNGASGMDPGMMSTMLMNQMMQNMNLGGDSGENNR